MYLNFLYFLLCASVTTGEDNSDEAKFLDLLPERDKQELLDNVARRILEEVKPKYSLLQSNKQVPDSNLDMHSDLISKLLKEERENLIRRHINKTSTDEAGKRIPRNSEDDSVKVQTLENEKVVRSHSVGHDRDNIDLTIREGKLTKQNEDKSVVQLTDAEALATTTVTGETNKTDADKETLSIEIIEDDKNTDIQVKSTSENNQVHESIIPVQVVYDTNNQNNLNSIPTAAALKAISAETIGENDTKYFETHRNDNFDDTRKTEVNENHNDSQVTEDHDIGLETKKLNLDENATGETITETFKGEKDVSESNLNQFKENKKPIGVTDNIVTETSTIVKGEEITDTQSIYEPNIAKSHQDPMTKDKTIIDDEKSEVISVKPTNEKNISSPKFSLTDISYTTQVDKPINERDSVLHEDNKKNSIINYNTNRFNDTKNVNILSTNPSTLKENTTVTINPTTIASILFTTESFTKANIENKEVDHSSKTAKEYTKRDSYFYHREAITEVLKTNNNTDNSVLTTDKNEPKAQKTNILTKLPKIQPKTKRKFIKMSRIKKSNRKSEPKPLLEPEVIIGNNSKTEFDSKTFYALQEKYNKNKEYRVYEISSGKSPFIQKNPKPESNARDITMPGSNAELEKDNDKTRIKFLRTEQKAEETPYYVPVHDYAPNNAYFNPNNRLGPNVNDVEIDRDYIEDQNKFLRTEQNAEDQETSYYVPVHDYAPNYAYFNPKNRLGPNNGDVEETFAGEREENIFDDDDDDYLKSGRKRSYRIKYTDNNHSQRKRVKPQGSNNKKKHQNSYPTSQDILMDDDFDMDYYFGRNDVARSKNSESEESIDYDNLRFPGSNEYNHPYNAIHRDQLKNHINTVRQIMFNNKRWGLIREPKTTRRPYKKTRSEAVSHPRAEEDKKTYHRSIYGNVVLVSPIISEQSEKDQEPDYYFGGIVDSREYTEKYITKKHTRSNKRQLKTKGSVCTAKRCKDIQLQESQERKEQNKKQEKDQKDKQEETDEEIKKKKKKKITTEDMILVANISDSRDVVEFILKMQSIKRSRDTSLDAYLTVIEDMIRTGNRGLYQYDWLRTAVDMQAALAKLLDLIKRMQNGGTDIHPADLQLLAYVVYLYDISEASLLNYRLDKELSISLSNNNKRLDKPTKLKTADKYAETHGIVLKDVIAMNRAKRANQARGRRNLDEDIPVVYVEIPALPAFDPKTKSFTSTIETDGFEDKLKKLEMFLIAVQAGVNDLHDAIKNVAMVSKHHQKLYKNLNELYLRRPSKKQVLEVLLHIFGTRLVGLVEESFLNGLKKEDYEQYIDDNEVTVKRTGEEFVFVLRLVEMLEKL